VSLSSRIHIRSPSPAAVITVSSFIAPLCLLIFVLRGLVPATDVVLVTAAHALSSLPSRQPASSFLPSVSCHPLCDSPFLHAIPPTTVAIPLYSLLVDCIGREWGDRTTSSVNTSNIVADATPSCHAKFCSHMQTPSRGHSITLFWMNVGGMGVRTDAEGGYQ